MTQTELPEFKGRPLMEVPQDIPRAGFLRRDFGKAFLEEYQGRVKADYKGNSVLNVLSFREGVVTGSNSFSVVLANKILRQERLRTATQADLEKALKFGVLPLRETYEDTGLLLRSEEEMNYLRNTPLAKDLAEQVKKRGIKFDSENPVMIPLKELELENADNYHGLIFRLREDAKIYESPILNKRTGNFSSEDIDEKTGLPTKLGEGNRTLHTRSTGLSRLILGRGSRVDSDDMNLAYSSDDGRIVVVKEGGNK